MTASDDAAVVQSRLDSLLEEGLPVDLRGDEQRSKRKKRTLIPLPAILSPRFFAEGDAQKAVSVISMKSKNAVCA